MQLAVLVLLMGFMMFVNVRHDDVRHNAITISLYGMIFMNLNKAFISLHYQLIPKAQTFRLENSWLLIEKRQYDVPLYVKGYVHIPHFLPRKS